MNGYCKPFFSISKGPFSTVVHDEIKEKQMILI